MTSASTPHTGATASGEKSAASSPTASTPATCGSRRPTDTSPSSKSTPTMANSSSASVPGMTATCSSASSAVRERRGSTTTTRPPRDRMPCSRPRASGAVISEPFEAAGLAPRISSHEQRSRSGTATVVGEPNRYAEASCLGYWSTVLAE